MWDDNEFAPKNTISFVYRSYDKQGRMTAEIERQLHGDDTEYLPNILLTFQYFLHGLTFTYINEVIACSDNAEHSSADEADTF
jgi:hypothetical protein